jgi:hypothetical protein
MYYLLDWEIIPPPPTPGKEDNWPIPLGGKSQKERKEGIY